MSPLLTGDFDASFIKFMENYFSGSTERWLKIDDIELCSGEGSWWIDSTPYTVFTEFLEALKKLEGSYGIIHEENDGEILYGEFEHIC
jgi:hypothetical protein